MRKSELTLTNWNYRMQARVRLSSKLLISISLVASVWMLSIAYCYADEQEWLTLLMIGNQAQSPVHVQWNVTRMLVHDPGFAESLMSTYKKRLQDAENAHDKAAIADLKQLLQQLPAIIDGDKSINFSINAYFVNNKRFLIEQIFNPSGDMHKFTYFCSGDLVYAVEDAVRSVEIHKNPQDYLYELMRGLPAFRLSPDSFADLKLSTAKVQQNPTTTVVNANSASHNTYKITIDKSTSLLSEIQIGCGNWMSSTASHIPQGEAKPVLTYSEQKDGSVQFQEEWRMTLIESISDPRKVNADFHLPSNYTITDLTGPKPVMLNSNQLLDQAGGKSK